ncbi:hypothetical protein CYMTET_36488 [Cymbomonas tetramitiformis]|uniref:Uncharacterized protein n=1 Tax=Cymbomonas tetramitiformis TaxID=36881 RepID=A0AAE0CHD8_9CHLO|nr:hypothetical protein CYMTET_36488 [Cymbomonas tetramitiformis]
MSIPLDVSFQRRRAALKLAAVAATAYYLHRSGVAKSVTSNCSRLLSAVNDSFEAFVEYSKLAKSVAKDLRQYVEAEDQTEVPQSIRQLLRVAQCREAEALVTSVTSSTVRGALKGARRDAPESEEEREARLQTMERVLDKVLSERTMGLLSVLMGNTYRMCFRATTDELSSLIGRHGGATQSSESLLQFIEVIGGSRTRAVMASYISTVVSSAVGAVIEKTKDFHPLDEALSTLTKPENRQVVQHIVNSLTATAVRTAIISSRETLSRRGEEVTVVSQSCKTNVSGCAEVKLGTDRRSGVSIKLLRQYFMMMLFVLSRREVRILSSEVAWAASRGSMSAVLDTGGVLLPSRKSVIMATTPIGLLYIAMSIYINIVRMDVGPIG